MPLPSNETQISGLTSAVSLALTDVAAFDNSLAVTSKQSHSQIISFYNTQLQLASYTQVTNAVGNSSTSTTGGLAYFTDTTGKIINSSTNFSLSGASLVCASGSNLTIATNASNAFSITDGTLNYLQINSHLQFVQFSIPSVVITSSNAAQNVQLQIANSDTTSSSSNSQLYLKTTKPGGGSPNILMDVFDAVNPSVFWTLAVDAGDSYKFKLCNSNIIGTATYLTVDNSGNFTLGDTSTTTINIGNSSSTTTVTGLFDTLGKVFISTTASPQLRILSTTAAPTNAQLLIEQVTGSGCPGLSWLISGAQEYTLGIDQNNSSVLKLTNSGSVSSGSILMSVTNAGVFTFLSTIKSPGLDTSSAGTLAIGATNATAVTITPATTFVSSIKSPGLDTASAGTLAIGGTNATAVTITPTTTFTNTPVKSGTVSWSNKVNGSATTNQTITSASTTSNINYGNRQEALFDTVVIAGAVSSNLSISPGSLGTNAVNGFMCVQKTTSPANGDAVTFQTPGNLAAGVYEIEYGLIFGNLSPIVDITYKANGAASFSNLRTGFDLYFAGADGFFALFKETITITTGGNPLFIKWTANGKNAGSTNFFIRPAGWVKITLLG